MKHKKSLVLVLILVLILVLAACDGGGGDNNGGGSNATPTPTLGQRLEEDVETLPEDIRDGIAGQAVQDAAQAVGKFLCEETIGDIGGSCD